MYHRFLRSVDNWLDTLEKRTDIAEPEAVPGVVDKGEYFPKRNLQGVEHLRKGSFQPNDVLTFSAMVEGPHSFLDPTNPVSRDIRVDVRRQFQFTQMEHIKFLLQ